jgi:prolyl 4-hydroxylase
MDDSLREAIEIPMRFESEPLLWCVEGVYTAEECRAFIEFIERSSPGLATNNPLYRDQDRVIRDDPEAAGELFRRLRPHLPESMGPLRLAGINERLRMYRYRAGQRFAPHMDHWYRPSECGISLHSVLVYFNDDFEGGETRFEEQVQQTIVPTVGAAVIFQHKVRHEGCPVRRGTKYAMRTDVMYEAPGPIGRVGLATA